MQQSVRASVWDMLRAQPSPIEAVLIQPSSRSVFRTWEPATKRLPPPGR
jgi:hypothetical protein